MVMRRVFVMTFALAAACSSKAPEPAGAPTTLADGRLTCLGNNAPPPAATDQILLPGWCRYYSDPTANMGAPAAKVAAFDDSGLPLGSVAFGLLIGACIGGNITPIGASANVVAVGLLQREGHPISFGRFMKMGLPFTVAATAAAYLVLWFVYR